MKRFPHPTHPAPLVHEAMAGGFEVLRTLPTEELEILAQEIRQRILEVCLKNGGHLGASLGAVELALALHASFDSPREPILWDVGHQAYAHKLLTGRWDTFASLRLDGGLSGFLSRKESVHDAFGAGHSSTSLSAALGLAWASRAGSAESGSAPWTVAVIGDGGLTAGLGFEALENIPELSLGPLLIVLNDNQMSISPSSGAIHRILSSGGAGQFFGLMGLDYVGPVDGHGLEALKARIAAIRSGYKGRPVVLHAVTQKGRGYPPAEELPAAFHGVSPIQEKTPGQAAPAKRAGFGEHAAQVLRGLAERDPKILAITAAMQEGTSLAGFARKFPDRFFDVGIAEGHAVTFAAGLASSGYKPVVCIYSTFLQRAIDQLIHDVALQELGVTFLIDRAGIVGADGPTHHGAFDLAYLSMIPNLKIFAPACLSDLDRLMTATLTAGQGPVAIRFPRGGGELRLETDADDEGVRWHRKPAMPQVIALALGPAVLRVEAAARAVDPDGERITVISCITVKPLPASVLAYLRAHPAAALLTAEDGAIQGGFGQSVVAASAGCARGAPARILGYGDHFIPHGSPDRLESGEGLSRTALEAELARLLAPCP